MFVRILEIFEYLEMNFLPNQKIHLVTTSSPDTSITVPVSLSVGTSFNVITNPESLPHFKQMLCVDNNTFLTDITSAGSGGNPHNQDIKTIVIQQPGDHHHHHNTIVTTSAPTNHNNSLTTILDAANLGVSTGSNNSQDGSLLNDSSSSSNNQATTIVVPNSTNLSSVKMHNDNFITAELLNGDVIPIRCKTTNAELYKSKLGSGGRGRCIKCKEQWYTPSEFEQMCGRGSSKDWKRSIRYGGRSLQALIDGGVITPHATNCSCSACADDDLVATGPVRLFTPYKRRKRNQVDREMENAKKRKNGVSVAPQPQTVRSTAIPVSSTTISAATITAPTVETGTVLTGLTTATTIGPATIATGATLTDISQSQQYQEAEEIISFKHDSGAIRNRIESWPNLNDSLDEATVEFFDNGSSLLETGSYIKQLESAYSTIVRATNDFKKIFVEYRESCNRKIDQLQTERDLLAARVSSTEIDEQSVANAMAGNEIVSPKRCANCNREALAECSLCRSTPYCSTFCQRKDWNSHQVQCNREPVEATQQIMLLVEDQS
ncbi:DEAF1 family protein [Megaselia abdita]